MDRFKSVQFAPNTIKCKVIKIIKLTITIQLLSYKGGILHVKASTGDFVRLIVKIFFGITRPINEALEEEKLNEFITQVKELEFKINIAKFLEIRKIKGVTVTHIEIKRKKLIVDFEIDDE